MDDTKYILKEINGRLDTVNKRISELKHIAIEAIKIFLKIEKTYLKSKWMVHRWAVRELQVYSYVIGVHEAEERERREKNTWINMAKIYPHVMKIVNLHIKETQQVQAQNYTQTQKYAEVHNNQISQKKSKKEKILEELKGKKDSLPTEKHI